MPLSNISSNPSKAVLVLGMHRSGTSAVSGCLRALGFHLGNNIMQPQEGVNDFGFFESVDVQLINERILHALKRTWHTIAPVPGGLASASEAEARIPDIVSLIRRDFAAHPLFAIKDPRICRLLPVWLRSLELCNFKPHIVFALRSPRDVAVSLHRRDSISIEKGLLLWHYHLTEAVAFSHGLQKVWIAYDELISRPLESVNRMCVGLGIDHETLSQNLGLIHDFLSPNLSRSSAAQLEDTSSSVAPRLEIFQAAWQGLATALAAKGNIEDEDYEHYIHSIQPTIRDLLEGELALKEGEDVMIQRTINLEQLKHAATAPFFYLATSIKENSSETPKLERQLLAPDVPNSFSLKHHIHGSLTTRTLSIQPLQTPGLVRIPCLDITLSSPVREPLHLDWQASKQQLHGCVILPSRPPQPISVLVDSYDARIDVALPAGDWDEVHVSIVAIPSQFPRGLAEWCKEAVRFHELESALRRTLKDICPEAPSESVLQQANVALNLLSENTEKLRGRIRILESTLEKAEAEARNAATALVQAHEDSRIAFENLHEKCSASTIAGVSVIAQGLASQITAAVDQIKRQEAAHAEQTSTTLTALLKLNTESRESVAGRNLALLQTNSQLEAQLLSAHRLLASERDSSSQLAVLIAKLEALEGELDKTKNAYMREVQWRRITQGTLLYKLLRFVFPKFKQL